MEPQTIVFFDAECLLCNRAVRWMARHDPDGCLSFAPLDGVTASRVVPADENDGESMLVATREGEDWRVRRQSGAVIAALSAAGGTPIRLALLKLFPRFLRDFGYRVVARFRYRVFGRIERCDVPDPGLRERVLP